MNAAIEMEPTHGIAALCVALGLSRATFYRHRSMAGAPAAPGPQELAPAAVEPPKGALGVLVPASDQDAQSATAPPAALVLSADAEAARNGANPLPLAVAPHKPKRSAPRALSPAEQAHVLEVLNLPRFCNFAPAEICATLLDEGTYLCSERTMYRILEAHQQVRERRNQLRHPSYVAPELMAQAPKQLWSWDITKLKTFVKCQYFHLYVILDVFSRYVVGWLVADYECGLLAKALVDQTCERQGISPGTLTFHADNGAAMVSQPVAFLLASLGITKSHSRPHVSDDNPFSEAHFKTLKYRPGFPERFASLEHARAFLAEFFTWYNTQHHHSGLAMMTPSDVHHGRVSERLAQRAAVLDAAYAAHPERFVRKAPVPAAPPSTVWINPPKTPAVPPPPPGSEEVQA